MSDYPDSMTLRPIEQWPGKPTAIRQRSNFSAQWRSTLELLDRELHHLGKSNRNAPTILQIAMREQDFRLDGMPRANAIPAHPGVILSIESRHGPLSYPCDRFDRWQDNLRAIALSLEALRKVDRYGVTKNAEQYTGFKAIGAASAPIPSVVEAEAILRTVAGGYDSALELGTMSQAYRRARRETHPDRHRGSRVLWDSVEAAAEVLRAAGRL
ncbi:molecular chaperone DnaJ [Rhodococcus sp. 06-470-2]|uniref:molecular chaperone DnaJ n=1 Tax=unclassified Rhodococcus (in: high G+C Gram-positive bacteria) TaxID=192944 RepID=UPI000B9B409C|nr:MULTISPECIES: molecular chaperone DnaJ [unclassified Rhodococcus (in: high G+C Gram-positive bacteria)]OZC59255.1 molecular chaperone DnaJ [Rhodococcus sp. 06-470-2]OZE66842.1 molecular chaperone DnaJ [Rhodococcus sp. 05-2221-1B]